MRALVTGGAGFIGSHLVDRLLERGDEVRALDDLSSGSLANLARALEHPRFTWIEGSVLDRRLVERASEGCQVVFHLAAMVGVALVLERPAVAREVNVVGTDHALRAAERAGAAFVFASSSEVYGPAARVPARETDVLLAGAAGETRWSYAASKALGEERAFAHARDGLRVLVCRFFNVVGPRQHGRHGMVLPRFVNAALRGEPLTVYGDGGQTRCFLHVADALDAVLALQGGGAFGAAFNVGSEEEVAIGELAQRVKRAAASDSPIVRMPYREAYGLEFADLPRRAPDLARLRERTGFVPRRDLDSIVRELVELPSGRAGALVRGPCGRGNDPE